MTALGIGGATEAPTIPSRHTRPHWVQTDVIDRQVRVSCMRCPTHVMVAVNGRQVGLVMVDIAAVERDHSLCSAVPR